MRHVLTITLLLSGWSACSDELPPVDVANDAAAREDKGTSDTKTREEDTSVREDDAAIKDSGASDKGLPDEYACVDDSDCTWRQSGCCGLCANESDPVPPPLQCGMACPAIEPQCLCINKRCEAGSLPKDARCDPDRDLCGVGTKCCATCCGIAPPTDGGMNPNYRCVAVDFSSNPPICPPVP